ncbi:hypothetical protein N658DRAFT_240672 [Parathielavia hyrcaniae]|uniref:Uncharacterized protein n=1 Tax=Parathielavia hyrcaniae TaxID=113614 RepID=A0AAN6Q5P0_9PEZI|nr:hypothetical protein N658DRAFT_240672 [Parathielavia hyrcaniae]
MRDLRWCGAPIGVESRRETLLSPATDFSGYTLVVESVVLNRAWRWRITVGDVVCKFGDESCLVF